MFVPVSSNVQLETTVNPELQAGPAVLKWLSKLSDSKLIDPLEHRISTVETQQFDAWATFSIDALLDVCSSDSCSLIFKDNAIRVFKPVATSPESRQCFQKFCLTRIPDEYKQEFGKRTWSPGIVRRVATKQQRFKRNLVSMTGTYTIEASSTVNDWDLSRRTVISGNTSDTSKHNTTTVTKVSWGMYSGSTADSFQSR